MIESDTRGEKFECISIIKGSRWEIAGVMMKRLKTGKIDRYIEDGWEETDNTLSREEELEEALKALVVKILDYEKVNCLRPAPGKEYCWNEVGQAVKLLNKEN